MYLLYENSAAPTKLISSPESMAVVSSASSNTMKPIKVKKTWPTVPAKLIAKGPHSVVVSKEVMVMQMPKAPEIKIQSPRPESALSPMKTP